MNQSQRKYAVEALRTLGYSKKLELSTAFNNNPINAKAFVPHIKQHSTKDVLNALQGMKNSVVLKSQSEMDKICKNADKGNSQYSSFSISTLAEPSNKKEIDLITKVNLGITKKYELEVLSKSNKIDLEVRRCTDIIMLGGNEECLSVLRGFENFKV